MNGDSSSEIDRNQGVIQLEEKLVVATVAGSLASRRSTSDLRLDPKFSTCP